MRLATICAALLKRTWATPASREAPAGKVAKTTASVSRRNPRSSQPVSSWPRSLCWCRAKSSNSVRPTPSVSTTRLSFSRCPRVDRRSSDSRFAGKLAGANGGSRFRKSRWANLLRPRNMKSSTACLQMARVALGALAIHASQNQRSMITVDSQLVKRRRSKAERVFLGGFPMISEIATCDAE
jgi:hypothetical protein